MPPKSDSTNAAMPSAAGSPGARARSALVSATTSSEGRTSASEVVVVRDRVIWRTRSCEVAADYNGDGDGNGIEPRRTRRTATGAATAIESQRAQRRSDPEEINLRKTRYC
jgi:hypothetical protein